MKQAIIAHAGQVPEIEYQDVAGRTDRLIVTDLLKKMNSHTSHDIHIVDMIINTYLEILPTTYNVDNDAGLYPGSRDLIENLWTRDDVGIGLITGNVEKGARTKLQPFNLNDYFVFGAFGSDAVSRDELPQIALYRAEIIYHQRFRGRDVTIIGDTVHDVTCGKSIGARSIAVIRREEYRSIIEAASPDFVCTGLENSSAIVDFIIA